MGTKVIDACGKCGGTVTDAARCSAVAAPSNSNEFTAIVGGSVGGLLLLAVIAAAYIRYKQQKVPQAKSEAAAPASPASPASAGFSIVPMQPLPPSNVVARTELDNQLLQTLTLLHQVQTLIALHAATNALPVQQALMPVPAPATFSYAPPHAVHGSSVVSDSGNITFIPSGAVAQDYGHAQAENQAAMRLLQLQIMQQQFRAQMQQPSAISTPPRDTAVAILATPPNFPAPSSTGSV